MLRRFNEKEGNKASSDILQTSNFDSAKSPARRKKQKNSTLASPQNSPPPNFNSCKDVVVPARDRAVVPTGLAIAAPHGTYARIAPRSGLAVKKFIDTGAGVVDEDYRGEVGVVLFNHSGEDFYGDKD